MDLLREYDNINVFNWEFDDYRAPGLVADQLNPKSSIDYPNRIDEILKIKSLKWRLIYNLIPKIIWKKEWECKPLNFFKSKNRIMRLNQIYFLKEFNNILKSDISFEKKIESANLWIQQIGAINSLKKDQVVFNQPLEPRSDLKLWTKVFYPFKLICVYRDPKDQIAELIKRNILFLPFSTPKMHPTSVNILSIYGRDRKGMMQFLTEALKYRLQDLDSLEKALEPDEVLMIDFEGLVNNYEHYKTMIENFLDISDSNHKNRRKYFDPELSKKNIGIYKNFLNEEDLHLMSELEEWYHTKII